MRRPTALLSLGLTVLATAALFTSCEEEPTERLNEEVDLRDYLLAPGASGDGAIRFSVDSTLFDPAPGGTDVRASTQTWVLNEVGGAGEAEQVFLIDKREDGAPAGEQFWRWGLVNDGGGIVNELDGVTYLSLVEPFTVGAAWDPLSLTDPDLIVPIEAEPIAIHKDWSATIDSVGVYSGLMNMQVPAVWVTHANSENRIELRRVTEVYGRNLGLLERTVDVLDSQNLNDVPWDEKAERGFRLRVRRIF